MAVVDQICLALDVPDRANAIEWVARTCHDVSVFKLGLELFCAHGPSLVDDLRNAGAQRIFLDLKLHDIPRTVERAVRRLTHLNVDLLTLHCSGGEAMMRAAMNGADGRLRLLGVTVLTSMDVEALGSVGCHTNEVSQLVEQRGRLALKAGMFGLVCSALEVRHLKSSLGTSFCAVTPGIRLEGHAHDDQRRVMTPQKAIEAGADLLVLGRTVTAARDPDAVLATIVEMVRS